MDGGVNVVKGSVNINDVDSRMTNTLVVKYGDENKQRRVVVAKIGKMSFFERVLNRLPNGVKQLKPPNG